MAGVSRIRIAFSLLLWSCSALCQHSSTPHTHLETAGPAICLPDAPSIQTQTLLSQSSNQSSSIQTSVGVQVFRAFADAAHVPATGPANMSWNRTLQPGLAEFVDQQQAAAKDSNRFLEKYLSPAAVRQSHIFHPLSDGTTMRRATYAASSILVQRDETGKKRLNTSYLLSVLTTAAAHSANRPYWRRSLSQPVSDFGSTVGNDAGMNLFHEFEPGLRALAKNHTPRFITSIQSKIESKIEGSARQK
jgi:hypothetical protein